MSFPRTSDQPPQPASVRKPRFLAAVPSGEPLRASFAREAAPRAEPEAEELVFELDASLVEAVAPPLPPPAAQPPLALEPGPAAQESELVARLGASVEVLRLQSERLAEQARADALEIGFQVARRILEIELSTSAESLFSLVRSAVRRAGESRMLTVRLHPSDKELIERTGGAERIDSLVVANLRLVADPLLSRGDCVVDADFGTVDGRLETRFGELRRVVASTLDGDSA